MDITTRASSIGTLADDTRRALYEYVSAQSEPTGREAAATAVGIPAHMVRFHLDKLVEAGLLETEFRRLSGKTGPGAGRPSKLYRRAAGTIAVSLPERRYDLVGHVLAGAIERAAGGAELSESVATVAHEEGLRIAVDAAAIPDAAATTAATPEAADAAGDLQRASAVLAAQGFEPQADDDVMILANCPFDSLARDHTALVCSTNLALVGGILEGLGYPQLRASAEPHEGRCCVAVRRDA